MPEYNIIAIDRAFAVLSALMESDTPLGLAALSKRTGVNKTTLLRICSTLERQGMLARDANARYSLGSFAGLLGVRYGMDHGISAALEPMLSGLAARVGESVSFQVHAGPRSRACLFRADPGDHDLVRDVVPGKSIPLVERGATARTLIAYHDEPNEQRALVRRQGYCISIGECHPGCAAVSVPVFRTQDLLHGVISVFGAAERFTTRFCDRLLPTLVDTSSHLRKALHARQPEAAASTAR